jgi:hypothetical protein
VVAAGVTGAMRLRLASLGTQLGALALLAAGAGLCCLADGDCFLLTADQRGHRAFNSRDSLLNSPLNHEKISKLSPEPEEKPDERL